MISIRGDYSTAKQYIIDLTTTYATRILPEGVVLRVKVHNTSCDDDSRGMGVLAYAAGNKDCTKGIVVYDSNTIKNNMYNMKSTFFNALAVHELCHIKHEFEEPGCNPKFYHSRPLYLDCMGKHSDRGMASPRTHPDRYSLRAYMGSDNKLVPQSINGMSFYICKDCRHSALWNNYNIGHHPYHCESCHSNNIAWTNLNPFDVYRIAKINEIDYVDGTKPAMYNEV